MIRSKIKKLFEIDPLKSFIELPILWIIVAIFFAISISIGLVIYVNSNIEFVFDYEGFNNFVIIFRVPISILAILITIIALLATTHRSVQTKEQLIYTNSQNNFSNHFKHIEEFEKYISKSIDKKRINIGNSRRMHKSLFPNTMKGDLSIGKEYLELIDNNFYKIKKIIKKFNNSNDKSIFDVLYQIDEILADTFSYIHLDISRSGSQVVRNGKRIILIDKTVRGSFIFLVELAKVLEQVLSFDNFVKIPSELTELYKIDLSKIPLANYERIDQVTKLDLNEYLQNV